MQNGRSNPGKLYKKPYIQHQGSDQQSQQIGFQSLSRRLQSISHFYNRGATQIKHKRASKLFQILLRSYQSQLEAEQDQGDQIDPADRNTAPEALRAQILHFCSEQIAQK